MRSAKRKIINSRARRGGHMEFNAQILGMAAGGIIWIVICGNFGFSKTTMIVGAVPAMLFGGVLGAVIFMLLVDRLP